METLYDVIFLSEQGKNSRKSAIYTIVNEHFEALLNAAIAKKSLRKKVSMGCAVLRDNRAYASLQDD